MPKSWSKPEGRVEALFAPSLPLALHRGVFTTAMKEFAVTEPRHRVVPGRDRAGRTIRDLPRPVPVHQAGPAAPHHARAAVRLLGERPRRGRQPGVPSTLMREYLDRPRNRLMEPFEDSTEPAAALCAADVRLGRACLPGWTEGLNQAVITLGGIAARFSIACLGRGREAPAPPRLPTRTGGNA